MKILNNTCQEKPDIDYPTQWGYKVIGRDEEVLKLCIDEVMESKVYECKVGNRSRNGKFVTLNTSCEVVSEAERYKIFKAFEEHEAVDMVL